MTGVALLGAALLLLAPARVHRGRPGGRHRPADPRGSPAIAFAAAVAVAVLCIGSFGGRRGIFVAAFAVPGALAALRWSRSKPARLPADAGLPRALDLAAAGLRAGLAVADALELAAPAVCEPTARRIQATAGLLRLGAPAGEAWADLADHPQLAVLAQVGRRGTGSGIRLADGWEDAAREMRSDLRAAALARATRAGVLAMAPLGLCFLPAFVCLGIVPDVIGLVGGSLRSLP